MVFHRKSSVGACEGFLLEAQAKTWRSDDGRRGKKPGGAAVLTRTDICRSGGALSR